MDQYLDSSAVLMWLMALVLAGLVPGCGGSVASGAGADLQLAGASSSLGTAGPTVSILRAPANRNALASVG